MDDIIKAFKNLQIYTATPESDPGIMLDVVLPSAYPFTYSGCNAVLERKLTEKYEWVVLTLSKKVWFEIPSKPDFRISELGIIEATEVLFADTQISVYEGGTSYYVEMTTHDWVILGAGEYFLEGRFFTEPILGAVKIKLQTTPLPAGVESLYVCVHNF